MKTLWILFCIMNEKWNTLFTFYACDREHAEQRAEDVLKKHPTYERLDLKEYPGGFRLVTTHLSGRIEEQ